MKAINRRNVKEVRNAVDSANMGYITRKEFARLMARARAPYVSAAVNLILYVRDRFYA